MFTRVRAALFIAFASALTAASLAATAQTPAAGRETSAASVASYALSQQMPVDPEVVVGTLPNGLRYYVRPNGKPARRAELRLVVRAGSVLEDDDQIGVDPDLLTVSNNRNAFNAAVIRVNGYRRRGQPYVAVALYH